MSTNSIFCRNLFLAMISIFFMSQNVFGGNDYINPAIDDDFVAWSNSIPKEEAEIQLKNFLSTFNSWDEAKKWLISKGFRVGMKSRLMSKKEREKYNNHPSVFANTVFWDSKKKGIILANSWLLILESKIFVYGVGIGIHYVIEDEQFTVYRVRAIKQRL